jgi:hypothetical protein
MPLDPMALPKGNPICIPVMNKVEGCGTAVQDKIHYSHAFPEG